MKIKLLVILSFCLLVLTGCYDNDEIDSLANVAAVGIEKGGFSFAIADTGSFSGEGDKGSESRSMCYFVGSDNIENAIDEINRRISKKLSFSHLSVIIAEKSAMTGGIYETVNYFEGMPDVRPQTLIVVSDVKPSEYLKKFKPSLEVNPEKYFLNIFQKSSAYIPVLKMSDYTNSVSCKTDVLSPVITGNISDEETNEENTYVYTAAILKEGKMRYQLEDMTVAGLLNSTKNVSFEYDGSKYIVNSLKKPEISARRKGTETFVNIKLTVGNKSRNFADEKFLEEKIKTHLANTSKKGYDIFGFSDIMKKHFRFQNSYDNYDWKSQITRCRFNVDVKISDKE